MKKILCLLTAAALCLSLGACGSTKNKEHEYILSLLEQGEYDKAIQVIEILRDGAGGANPQPAQTTATEAPATAATEAPAIDATEPSAAQTPASPTVPPSAGLTDRQKLAADTVKAFLKSTGDAAVKEFEEVTGSKARPTTVTHAMEYRLGNWDGKGTNAHCMLIWLDMDVACDGGANDSVQILLDMDTGKCYNSLDIDWSLIDACDGNPTNKEEFNTIALNSYHSYVAYGNEFIWADMEIREELTQEELAAINEALK